jgi:hypothetical protein
MEHQRHRAPEPHPRKPLVVTAVIASVIGVVVGAAVVGAAVVGAGWLSENSAGDPLRAAVPTVSTTPSDDSTVGGSGGQPSAEDRNEIVIPTLAPQSTVSTDPVLLLGDSLAVGISTYVDAGIGERGLTVDAAEGRNSATSVSLLAPYADSAPPVWLVSLGTNDNIDEFEQQAKQIMKLAGPDRCVVWFDVWRVETDDTINAALEGVAADYPNLHLIPWNATSTAHPEWFSGNDVHPSSTGYAVRGQMGVDALQYHCG